MELYEEARRGGDANAAFNLGVLVTGPFKWLLDQKVVFFFIPQRTLYFHTKATLLLLVHIAMSTERP